jgi:hypothetical protein
MVRSRGDARKAKGKNQKADVMKWSRKALLLPYAFCLLPFSSACSTPDNAAARQPPPARSSRPPAPPNEAFIVGPGLPPLSALAVANSREQPEIVRAVHLFAADHPEVLNYVPCFCGCQNAGHKHNDDCFVAKRNGAGKVSEWDVHGVG